MHKIDGVVICSDHGKVLERSERKTKLLIHEPCRGGCARMDEYYTITHDGWIITYVDPPLPFD